MAEGTINDPILRANEALKAEVGAQSVLIKDLVQNSRAQFNKEQEQRAHDQQQQEKETAFIHKIQGQEVQVGRDGQLLQEKTRKATENISGKAPKDGTMASEGGQETTNTLLGDLQANTKALSDYMPFGMEENWKTITGKIGQSIDKQAGLENLFGAVKGDFSLMLGGLNALQNVPGFNILKVLLMTLTKYVWKGLKSLWNVMTNSKELSEDQLKLAKLDQKRLKKLGKDSKLADKEFKMDGLQLKTKKKGEGWRITSQKGLSRKERGLIKRSTKRADIQKFGKRGAMQEKMARNFNSLWKSLKPILKSFKFAMMFNKVKTLLILGVIGGIAYALYKLKDKMLEWLGWQPKNAEDAAIIEGETLDGQKAKHGSTGGDLKNIKTDEEWWGGNVDGKEDEFFDKDFFGFSDIDREKVKDASSKQLLGLLREEGDDLSSKDKQFIDEELKRRLKSKTTNTGEVMEDDYYNQVKTSRAEFNKAEQERLAKVDEDINKMRIMHGGEGNFVNQYSQYYQFQGRNTTNFQPTDVQLAGVN